DVTSLYEILTSSKENWGFCHLCTGQEAIPVGMEHAITRDDVIITAYRCHGYTLMRGTTVHQVLAELMGRSTGITYGKGGFMHMFAKSFYGGNGIVLVGAGTQKYLGVKNATFIIYGDGAANQGQVFEAFNMAKLWDLPAIFVCENNLYVWELLPQGVLQMRNIILRVNKWYGCISSKASMRVGKRLEFVTYRYGDHSMSDPDPGTTYRTREEIQHMRSTNDPITGLRLKILECGGNRSKDARAIVDEAVEKAKNDPLPKDSELWTDIY
ncbi:7471_t:CDS:2, partial [Dentiscutata heterogama]